MMMNKNYCGSGQATAERTPDMQMALRDLGIAVENLSEKWGGIYNKLIPVMQDAPPTGPIEKIGTCVSQCAYSGKMREGIEKINLINREMSGCLDRLEV